MSEPDGRVAGPDAARVSLWTSFAALGVVALLLASGVFDRRAGADMVAERNGFTMMTTLEANGESLFVIDDTRELLLVYRMRGTDGLEVVDRESLPELFARGRAAYAPR